MSLEKALKLAAEGFYILPLAANSKLPVLKDFPNQATRSNDQIKWWSGSHTQREWNFGISTSRFKDDEALVVVDIDNAKGKTGDAEILKLELDGFEFPETYTQTTPTGGRHLVYRAKKPVKQGSNVLAPGIDIRSRGGYIVASGSTINGKAYTDNGNYTVAPCPQWIIDKCGEAPTREASSQAPIKVSLVRAVERAMEYLPTAPVAEEGAGGDETTYKVSARLKDFGLGDTETFDLLAKHWNPRCLPPWPLDELRTKVINVYRYGNRPRGADSPEAAFPEALPSPPKQNEEGETRFYLDEINDHHALIFLGNGHSILHETVDADGRPIIKFLPEPSFKRKFSHLTVQVGKGKPRTYAEEWLDWSGKRVYNGLCFAPEKDVRHGYYNLWRGFVCKPVMYDLASPHAQRGFDLFLEHALTNVCQGDKTLFHWLMGYFAHMVQKPAERPLTTLVFRGKKGTGKNTLVDRVGNLLGHGHYLVVHDGRYLTSNFNGHMESCLMMVLDEAFWSGDKAAEGKLKGITTAPKILIERKGMEAYPIDNFVRLVVIGNEDWLVPASHDERRYAVFDLGEGRKQDGKFFEEMRILIDEQGGNSVLLDYLLSFDLSKVNVNVALKTKALLEQKQASLEPFEEWWLDCLSEGGIASSDFGYEWPTEVSTDRLRDSYGRYLKQRQIRSRLLTNEAFGKKLRTLCPSLLNAIKRTEEGHVRVYRIPPLAQARKEWDQFMGQETEWK